MIRKLVRLVWALQPRWLRHFELDLHRRLILRPLDPNRAIEPGDVIVSGLLGTASGLGQTARQTIERLKEGGYRVLPSNLSRMAVMEDFEAGPLWPEGATQGGVAILAVNPDIIGLTISALGWPRLRSRRVIGIWYWELETFPKNWRQCLRSVDEVWVGSHFIANALRKIAGGKPVHVLPPPLDVESFPTAPRQNPLPAFAGRPVVFFMYDVRSTHARKNPEDVIKVFQRATQGNPDPVLVIKINNGHSWPESEARLRKLANGASNIHFMQEKLSADGMKDLLARADVVLSLHRSEGFGLLMAEAMAAARPVIATGWSANLDFMTPDCSVLIDYKMIPVEDPQHAYDKFGAVWADPDLAQAAEALKDLLANPEKRKAMGAAARKQIAAYLSKDRWRDSLPDSFKKLALKD